MRVVHEGLQVARRPRRPVGFGDEAGDLAGDVLQLGERADPASPRSAPGGDRWLGEVVDDEANVRQAMGELQRSGSSRGRTRRS